MVKSLKLRAAAIVAAVVMAFAGMTVMSTPAHALATNCVTKTEYDGVKPGWTKSQVKTWIGVTSWYSDWYLGDEEITQARHCGDYNKRAAFSFTAGIMHDKDWTATT